MNENLTRRKFITNSTAGTIGAAVGLSMASGFDAKANSGLKESNKTFLFSRNIPFGDTYDIIVAGGGPAGSSAAVCAARLGAKVLLVEATGCLGGMGTSGLVCAFDPMSNGKQMLVGGFMKQLVDSMYKRGFLEPTEIPEIYQKVYHHWTKFQPEGLKLLLDEFLLEAGVEIRFFTKAVDAVVDNRSKKVNGIIIHNIEGFQYIKAKNFIDCTGDAVLADICGVECREPGRDTPNIMPATLTSLFTNIDFAKASPLIAEMKKIALEEGHFTQYDRMGPALSKIGYDIGYLNGGHIFNLDALRCRSLSDGMILGRKLAQEHLKFFIKYVPGCENIEHVTTASLMGVRESRRIKGEYELNFDDYIGRRHFPDQIGVFNKAVDIHPYNTSKEEYERFLKEYNETARLHSGEYFGIPYSILVPEGWKNLWVAGRCASSDVMVQGSIRVQPAASMMGQAAGTAAAQSIKTGQAANELDTEQLVKTLRENGAFLPQETLSTQMTRS